MGDVAPGRFVEIAKTAKGRLREARWHLAREAGDCDGSLESSQYGMNRGVILAIDGQRGK